MIRSALARLIVPALGALLAHPSGGAAALTPVGSSDATCVLEAATKGVPCNREVWGSEWLTPGRVGEVLVATTPARGDLAGAYEVFDPEAADRWRVEVFSQSANDGVERWRRSIGGSVDDHLVGVVSVPEAAIVTRIAGSDLVTAAFDPANGATRWEDSLVRVPGVFGPQASVVANPDGGTVYVAAHVADGVGVVAYDVADGARRWSATLPAGPFGGVDLAVSASTLVLATPQTADADPLSDSTTLVGLDPDSGAVQWSTEVVAAVDTDPRAVALSDDGATVFLVAVNDARFTPPARAFVAGLSPDDGALRWQEVFEGNGDVAVLDADAGTHLHVAAMEQPESGARDGLAFTYDALGDVIWEQRDNGVGAVGDEGFRTLAVDRAHGAVTFVGRADPLTLCTPIGICLVRAFDAYAVSYDAATGTRRWLTHWGRRPIDGDEYGNDIAVAPDARGVIVSGVVRTAENDFGGDFDPVILRYDEPPPIPGLPARG